MKATFLKLAIGERSRRLRHFSALVRFVLMRYTEPKAGILFRNGAVPCMDFSSMIRRDVIVIGGSAGSMKPLGCLASSLPANLQAAVFLMAHYTLPKFLYGILQDCKLRVRNAVDLERVEPGNLYVCPADNNVSLENGVMRVERSPRESVSRPSINALFRSAAMTYGRRVVGVVLSGLLADGTSGLWHIKKYGGVTMVQDPASAEFPAMPQSAINDVAIDFVLSVEGIAQKLIELAPKEPSLFCMPARGVRVLIVEDESLVANNLAAGLKEHGYTVSAIARSGESALESALTMNPDVILMDIRLGGSLSGTETARRIWERFQIPVVYVTAFADADTLNEVKTTVNYGYVVKPFATEAAHAAIQLALDRREKELRFGSARVE